MVNINSSKPELQNHGCENLKIVVSYQTMASDCPTRFHKSLHHFASNVRCSASADIWRLALVVLWILHTKITMLSVKYLNKRLINIYACIDFLFPLLIVSLFF